MDALPVPAQFSTLDVDIRNASPDAVLVWGSPGDTRYAALIHRLILQCPENAREKIVDPVLGEVGIVLFAPPKFEAGTGYQLAVNPSATPTGNRRALY